MAPRSGRLVGAVVVSKRHISLRGVRVHNLQGIDLDLPHDQLVAICGVSGSGKTSLALDTLYAEGQRRYVESLSAYARQFLERLEKPAADRIDGIPPAIAVTTRRVSRSRRATVGTTTETSDYLRLLLAKIGAVVCRQCGQPVRRDHAQSATESLGSLAEGTPIMIAYPAKPRPGESPRAWLAGLREDGARRAICGSQMVDLTDWDTAGWDPAATFHVVVDRLVLGDVRPTRLHDSMETALIGGRRTWCVYAELPGGTAPWPAGKLARLADWVGPCCHVQGRAWLRRDFSRRRECVACGLQYADPDPRLLSFNHPLGACPECEGFGSVVDIDLDLVVPDQGKSLREGAIAPWNTPAYAHELDELLALAGDYGIPVDVPFRALTAAQQEWIDRGVAERNFGGLRGFFAWLERRKYKMHLRVFLSRWRSVRPCPVCGGARLRPEALAVELGGKNMADLGALEVDQAVDFFQTLQLSDSQRSVGRVMLEQVQARLDYLRTVGLGYLTLDRTLCTLSRGELQRVVLTSALGSSLAGMLYVLDEPSVGLHPTDVERLIHVLTGLRDRGNTVVVVEHEAAILRQADQLVEFGPGAGASGGRVTFQGSPAEMLRARDSITGPWLSGTRGGGPPATRRPTDHGWIRLSGARGNNLKNITVRFPLRVLCVVSGVSGAGKSTLVQETLVPALGRRLHQDGPKPYPYDELLGDGQLDDLVMIDQGAVGRTPRSNPVTYIKAFDEIRTVFSNTVEARTNNFGPGHFSFNVDGGRCDSCHGDGQIAIDMQFLADVYMKCSQCQGRRYRRDILRVKYRGLSIADVLALTVREAWAFFRGHPKVQSRLQQLIDVGLDYLRLGQPAKTLSGGEAQRLKLAGHLSTTRRGRTLFVLDEPTTGLHFADVVKLLDCFDALLSVGHSLIVIEHNVQIMQAADYLIDMGPGAAADGGQIVACGTPEQVAQQAGSATARALAGLVTGAAGPVPHGACQVALEK
ncbi:MAG: excinuclease ABC subunit A [Planctomycetes bacterium RBG_16_64_10]|nr:MAG: excinuclease ABC subunit A [Planctomycetes bacterium RBG_16_64_10]